MKSVVFLFILFSASMCTNAQNVVYDENAEVRTVGAFTGVEVSGTVALYLSQGTTRGVAISAGDLKYNNKIKTEVKNGVLHISVDGGMWNGFNWANKKLKAYVTVIDLHRIEASGATYVSTTGIIKSNELKLEISGASEVKGVFNVEKLNADVSGASVAKLSGRAGNARIDASGAATIGGYNFEIDTCKASTSGASGVRVFVKDQLIADASGGSFIYFKGTPLSTNLNSSAGSTIKNKTGSE